MNGKKCAIVILYDGTPIEGEDHRRIAEFVMNNMSCVAYNESIDVYGLNHNEITQGVKIVAENKVASMSPIDAAATFIGETFTSSIAAGVTTFAANIGTVYVNIKLHAASLLSEKDEKLIKSIEILSQKDAYKAISPAIRRRYHLTAGIIEAIHTVYDGVCQGQLVIW